MEIKGLIERYGISLYGEDKIRIDNVRLVKKDKAEEMIKSQKPEIMSYLKEEKMDEKRACEEREAKSRL